MRLLAYFAIHVTPIDSTARQILKLSHGGDLKATWKIFHSFSNFVRASINVHHSRDPRGHVRASIILIPRDPLTRVYENNRISRTREQRRRRRLAYNREANRSIGSSFVLANSLARLHRDYEIAREGRAFDECTVCLRENEIAVARRFLFFSFFPPPHVFARATARFAVIASIFPQTSGVSERSESDFFVSRDSRSNDHRDTRVYATTTSMQTREMKILRS